jgi:hypothetical protein
MQFGRNTNVTVGPATLHVQTEDRGVTSALLDTTVYFQGRILHRRINNYFDLLPLTADSEQALKLRLDAQHRSLIDEIRSGQLQLSIPPPQAPVIKSPGVASDPAGVLSLELANPKNWLAGKRASIQIAVRDEHGKAAAGAQVTLRIDGAVDHAEVVAVSGPEGIAQLDFEIPKLTGAEPALRMTAANGAAKGHLKFSLRTKPRVPTA